MDDEWMFFIEFDHFVSTCRMAKLDGFQRGRYEWLVDPPTTEGNPKFEYVFLYFWNVLIIAHFPDCFYIFAASHNTTGYPWAKGTEIEFHDGRSFSFFQTFPPFLFGSLCGDLVEGRFQKFSCITDSTRCGCVCLFRCSTFFVFKIF
jgi:hypothetical protein